MSCSCNCNPCHCDEECDATNEPLASALDNFITAFFGSITKTCVDGAVVWHLPCELETGGVPGFPRNAGEGLACYFLRYIQTAIVGPQGPAGPTGPQGEPGTPASGLTATITVVTDVDYTSPDILETKMSLTFVNGSLTAVGVPVQTVVTTAANCP